MNRKIVYIITVTAAMAALIHLLPGTLCAYEPKGKRDPFIPLIGQNKGIRSEGLEGVLTAQDVLLEGIAVGPTGKNIAILNGQIVKEKDKFGLLQINKITNKTVELSIDGKKYNLSLQEEEGIKVGE